MRRTLAAVALLTALSTLAATADAQSLWPTPRADQLRSGRAITAGRLHQPQVLRSYYLGGFVSQRAALAADLTGDDAQELVTAVGGKLRIGNGGGALTAESPNIGLDELVGVWDLDGDGADELLARSSRLLAVVSPTTGDLLWSRRSNGNWEFLAVVDTDNDGFLELIAHEYNGASCNGRDLWRFDFHATGYATPTTVQLLANNGCASQPFVVANLDGSADGSVEIAQHSRGNLAVRNPADGALLASASMYPTSNGSHLGRLWARDLDGDGTTEIVHLSGGGYDQILYAARYTAGNLNNLWTTTVESSSSNTSNINVVSVGNSVVDVDGDGTMELVVSVYNDQDDRTWRLWIVNALTGVLEHAVDDQLLQDVADLDGDGHPELITLDVQGAGVAGRRFGTLRGYEVGDAGPVEAWQINGVGAHPRLVRGDATTGLRPLTGVTTQDLDGDGTQDLYVDIDEDGDERADVLEVWSLAGPITPLARYTTDKVLTEVLVLATGANLSGPITRTETWISRSDGELGVLDRDLVGSNLYRGGGHVTDAIAVSDFGQRAPFTVMIPNSRGQLELLKPATTGSFDPVLSLSTNVPVIPSALPVGPGHSQAIVLPTFEDNQITLTLTTGTGTVLWSVQTGFGLPHHAATFRAARLNDDDNLDLVTVLFNPATELTEVMAFDGTNGNLLWRFFEHIDDYPSPRDTIITDVNDDGFDDVVYNAGRNSMTLIDGTNGATLRYASRTYERSIVAGDLDGDGDLEIIRGPGPSGFTAHDLRDGTLLWQYRTPIDYECDGLDAALIHLDDTPGLDVVVGSRFGLARGFAGQQATPTAAPLWETWLFDGQAFDADPGQAGSLTSPAVTDLDQDGTEDALFGSTDGHLYAVSATGALVWSVDLGFSVGQPVLADLDFDGHVEVIVSAADGFVHVIGDPTLPAPTAVRDVALDANLALVQPDLDVDTTNRLVAVGVDVDPVEFAVGYQARVVSAGGSPISDWFPIANGRGVLRARLSPNQRYRVQARAVDSANSFGATTDSDGFLTVDDAPPEAESLTVTPRLAANPALEPVLIVLLGRATDANALDRLELTIAPVDDPGQLVARFTRVANNELASELQESWNGRDLNGDPAPPGDYLATLRAVDRAGNDSLRATDLTLVNARAPAPPFITAPADRSTVDTTSPTIAGTAFAAASVTIYERAAVLCEATVTDSDWSCTPDLPLDPGGHTIVAFATSDAQLRSTASTLVNFTVVPTADTDAGLDTAPDTTQDVPTTEDVPTPEDVTPDTPTPDDATPDATPDDDADADADGPAVTLAPPITTDDSCGCQTVATPTNPWPLALLLGLAALAALRRR